MSALVGCPSLFGGSVVELNLELPIGEGAHNEDLLPSVVPAHLDFTSLSKEGEKILTFNGFFLGEVGLRHTPRECPLVVVAARMSKMAHIVHIPMRGQTAAEAVGGDARSLMMLSVGCSLLAQAAGRRFVGFVSERPGGVNGRE